MGINKNTVSIGLFLLLNGISYLSPRYDLLTVGLWLMVSVVMWHVIDHMEKRNREYILDSTDELVDMIDQIIYGNEDVLYLEDDYGLLRDKITKTIGEYKQDSQNLQRDRDTLKSYIEDIHHQIQTPLTGIGLMVDLIDQDNGDNAEYIKIIRSDLHRIQDLTATLLKMSYLDANLTSLKEESFSAYGMVLDTLHSLESVIGTENIEVTGEDYQLIGDRGWIMESLHNLIKNAYQASDNTPVEIRLEHNQIYQSIIVVDYTDGIPTEIQPFIYDRFYKVDRDSKGFGVGLSMVKTIMENSGGEILYRSLKDHNEFEMRFYR